MEAETPPELLAERDALIEEIYAAFGDVTREGGMSWHVADAHDGGSIAQFERAPSFDTESSWKELVGEPGWKTSYCYPAWSFLDSIGFRYYLPLGMMQCVQGHGDEGILFHLTLDNDSLRDFTMDKWSLLDPRQERCVARFLVYMAKEEAAWDDGHILSNWIPAFDSYWGTRCDHGIDEPTLQALRAQTID